MNENLVLYALAGICIVASPVLFIVRDQMLRSLSPAQIKALLGAEEQLEVTTPKSTRLVMKSHYPAAFLLLAGVALAGATYYVSALSGDVEWEITGSIAPPPGQDIGRVFDKGVITFWPYSTSRIGRDGRYKVTVKIPGSKRFEDKIEKIGYELAVGDKSYFFDIWTKQQWEMYDNKSPSSLIAHANSRTREYKPIPLREEGNE